MSITMRKNGPVFSPIRENLIGQGIAEAFNPLGQFLVSEGKRTAKKDTRKYERSIRYRISGKGLKTQMRVFAGAEHSEFADAGRKPGKMPPFKPIYDWVRRKGLGAQAFLIKTRRAIAAGTRRTFNRATGKRRTSAQSLKNQYLSITFLIRRSIGKKGVKGTDWWPNIRTTYAAQISVAITTARNRVTVLLNA